MFHNNSTIFFQSLHCISKRLRYKITRYIGKYALVNITYLTCDYNWRHPSKISQFLASHQATVQRGREAKMPVSDTYQICWSFQCSHGNSCELLMLLISRPPVQQIPMMFFQTSKWSYQVTRTIIILHKRYINCSDDVY